jgi:hypothetical protein
MSVAARDLIGCFSWDFFFCRLDAGVILPAFNFGGKTTFRRGRVRVIKKRAHVVPAQGRDDEMF